MHFEDFLNLRFEESKIEREEWGQSQEVDDIKEVFYRIAKRKEMLYKQTLDLELANQTTGSNDDPTLSALNDIQAELNQGKIPLTTYWGNVDSIMRKKDKNYIYKRIDNIWRRFDKGDKTEEE